MSRIVSLMAMCLLQFAICTSCAGDDRPLLEVFWSRSCGPCRGLLDAWNADLEFREWMAKRFRVKWTETNSYPLPRIRVLGDELCGYDGKQRLVNRLTQIHKQHIAHCRGRQPRPPQPTLAAPEAGREILAEMTARERQLRAEITEHILWVEGIVKDVYSSLDAQDARMAELVAAIDKASRDGDCAEQIAGLRTEVDKLQSQRAELRAEFARLRDNTLLSEQARPCDDPDCDTGSPLVSADDPAGAAPLTGEDRPDDHSPAAGADDGAHYPTHQAAGPAMVDLSPILGRLRQLEQRINQPLTVELFDSGKPLGLTKQVNPHGGYLPLDIFAEERILSQKPPTTQEEKTHAR